MTLKRSKKGEIIWPKIDRSTQSKIVASMKDHYKAAGMWKPEDERELWGEGAPLLAAREDRERGLPESEMGIPNEEVEKAGWCLKCKEYPCECSDDDECIPIDRYFR